MTDSKSRCVVEIWTDTRPIVYLTIDRLSTNCRPTIDRLSTDYRPTLDRLSTDCRRLYRPLCRPLCRPISRSTLPRVNKIHGILFTVGNVDRDIGRHSGRYSGRHSVDSRSKFVVFGNTLYYTAGSSSSQDEANLT